MAVLLADLGVVKTHSRPHVSNDNPFSEVHFKTRKYWPAFPERFGALEDARAFGQEFVTWYDHEHQHRALGYLTTAMVHHGVAEGGRDQRQQVLAAAYAAHPERFVRGRAAAAALPETVRINPPLQRPGREDPQTSPATTIVPLGDLPVHPMSNAPVPSSIKEVVR